MICGVCTCTKVGGTIICCSHPSCSFLPMKGVMTGSVYKDFTLMKNGFPGESITNGSVIAIKTHEFGAGAIAGFDRAILLIRDPFASLQARVLTSSAKSAIV